MKLQVNITNLFATLLTDLHDAVPFGLGSGASWNISNKKPSSSCPAGRRDFMWYAVRKLSVPHISGIVNTPDDMTSAVARCVRAGLTTGHRAEEVRNVGKFFPKLGDEPCLPRIARNAGYRRVSMYCIDEGVCLHHTFRGNLFSDCNMVLVISRYSHILSLIHVIRQSMTSVLYLIIDCAVIVKLIYSSITTGIDRVYLCFSVSCSFGNFETVYVYIDLYLGFFMQKVIYASKSKIVTGLVTFCNINCLSDYRRGYKEGLKMMYLVVIRGICAVAMCVSAVAWLAFEVIPYCLSILSEDDDDMEEVMTEERMPIVGEHCVDLLTHDEVIFVGEFMYPECPDRLWEQDNHVYAQVVKVGDNMLNVYHLAFEALRVIV